MLIIDAKIIFKKSLSKGTIFNNQEKVTGIRIFYTGNKLKPLLQRIYVKAESMNYLICSFQKGASNICEISFSKFLTICLPYLPSILIKRINYLEILVFRETLKQESSNFKNGKSSRKSQLYNFVKHQLANKSRQFPML
jgi:hypothetical protein